MAPRPQRRQGGRPRSPSPKPGQGRNVKSAQQKYVLDYQPSLPRPPRGPKAVAPIPGEVRVDRGEAAGIPARELARRKADDALLSALEAAQDGDDSLLLPYQPTPSISPPRPRTRAAGYDEATRTLRIRFRDGTVYGYGDVSPQEWRNFKRVKSPGRAVNRTLNNHVYWREPNL